MFADLWGDERLLSSFDSINVTPPAAAGSAPMPGGSWLHTDQGPNRKGVACIQGLVNLVDVGPQAGTGALQRPLLGQVMGILLDRLAQHSVGFWLHTDQAPNRNVMTYI